MTHMHVVAAVAALALIGCVEGVSTDEPAVALPAVGSSSDLSAFQGARAGQAEGGIRALGYELARTEGLTAYWSNAGTGACARIVTSEGRYASVDMLAAEDC